MIHIGEFARLGQVSMRMLRHYDQLGLLTPDHVDPWTGYRSYSAGQLARLNRIVALKDLGFPLAQVAVLLDGGLDGDELRVMLHERRMELEREHEQARQRLAGVEARLHLIDKEHDMSIEYVTKSLPAVRLAARSTDVEEGQAIGEVVGPLFEQVGAAVAGAGGSLRTAIASYDVRPGGIHVIVGYTHDGPAPEGTTIVELPAVEHAVCCVHLGAMTGIGAAWQALVQHAETSGWDLLGPCREDYLQAEGEDQSSWVTELQQPVRR